MKWNLNSVYIWFIFLFDWNFISRSHLIRSSPVGFIVLKHSFPKHWHHFWEMLIGECWMSQLLHNWTGWSPWLIICRFSNFAFDFRIIHNNIGSVSNQANSCRHFALLFSSCHLFIWVFIFFQFVHICLLYVLHSTNTRIYYKYRKAIQLSNGALSQSDKRAPKNDKMNVFSFVIAIQKNYYHSLLCKRIDWLIDTS